MSLVVLEVQMKSHLIEKWGQASHFLMNWIWGRSRHQKQATMNLDFFVELSERDLGHSLVWLSDFNQSWDQQVEAELGLFRRYLKLVQSCEPFRIISYSFKLRLWEAITTTTDLSSTQLSFNCFPSLDQMSLHFPHS